MKPTIIAETASGARRSYENWKLSARNYCELARLARAKGNKASATMFLNTSIYCLRSARRAWHRVKINEGQALR